MHAVLLRALKGHPRAVHFGEPVGVVGLEPVGRLDAPAHVLGVGLGPDKGDAQRQIPGVQALGVAKVLSRYRAKLGMMWITVVLKLLHELQLALAVAGAGRDGEGPQPFGRHSGTPAPR